jgi:hypothetical protein
MKEYLKSSPHFYRLIGSAALALVAILCVLAPLVPAPLGEPANIAHPPNPVKSAWFLLWLQELVSYGNGWIIVPLLLAGLTLTLPWLPLPQPTYAIWFDRHRRWLNVGALFVFLFIVTLTLVAAYCRGGNWSLVAPF